MSAPLEAREELAVRFIESMLRSPLNYGSIDDIVTRAFRIADKVIAMRSPGS